MSGWSVLYAVTDANVRAGSAPARIITAAGLRAWGGEDPALAGAVCLALARRGGCLPARAGARIEGGANAVRAWLRRSAEQLRARLDEIDGRVEFVATLEVSSAAPGARARPSSGAAYLRAAAARSASQRAAQEALRARAEAFADALPAGLAAAPRRLVESAHGRVDLSLLAPRAAKPVFALAVADAARRLERGLRLIGSGPWAPHSFAGLALEGAARRANEEEIAHAARA